MCREGAVSELAVGVTDGVCIRWRVCSLVTGRTKFEAGVQTHACFFVCRSRFPPRPAGSSCRRGDDQSPALAGASDASTCNAAAGHGRNLSLRHPALSRRSAIGRRAECPHAAGTRCVVVAAPVDTAAGHGRIYNAPLRQGWQRVRSMVVRQTWRVAGRCGHRPLRRALGRQ